MKWYAQIVKPSTHNQQSTSVLVQIDSQRYLFNCGEGTQRLGFENKIRMSKLSAIFLTRIDWETMGGLPGMLLTLADSGMGDLTVCGGYNLTHVLAATRHFIMRDRMGLRVNEMLDGDATAAFQDKNLQVKPVFIYPDGYKVLKHELGPNESAEAQARRLLVSRAFGMPRTDDEADKRRKQPVDQQKKGYYAEQCEGATMEVLMQQLEEKDEEANNKKRARSPDHSARQITIADTNLPKARPSRAALSYIAQGPDVLGKFDVKAAQALGLKPGPLYGKLTKGESVKAPDGTVIHPSQCVGPTKAGGIFIVIDCPSTLYIDSLVSNPQFAPFLTASETSDEGRQAQLVLVVHSLGNGVALDERYKSWVNRFPSHVHHMLSSPEFVPDANPFQRHLRVQASMAAVDPRVYVLPQGSSQSQQPLSSFSDRTNVSVPSSLAVFEVEPRANLDTSKVRSVLTPEEMLEHANSAQPTSDVVAVTMTTSDNDAEPVAMAESCAADQDDVNGCSHQNEQSTSELIVCPIGTGSSVPGIYRNVSANIVSVEGYGGIVLDCGESTVSLLKRFLGHPHRNAHNKRIAQTFTQFVSSIKLLYISHMHADHHLGAIMLLREWTKLTGCGLNRPRMTVVAPARFWTWLCDYSGVENIGLERLDFVCCHDLRVSLDVVDDNSYASEVRFSSVKTKVDKLLSDLGLVDIKTCSVVHCPWAYGLSLTHSSGWKLVYSGDTRPCTNLVTLGRAGRKPPTILLHEATHSDDLLKDAKAKRHTTVSEAVAMALGMGAENLLMTHFSQRCLSLPRWKWANVQAVNLTRYGQLSKGPGSVANGVGSSSMMDVPEDDEPEEVVERPTSREDVDAAKKELMLNLVEALSECSSASDDEQEKGVLGDLNVAAAFDLSAYAPSDIARYQANTRRLQKAMRAELKLFIAEEECASDIEDGEPKQQETPTKTKKDVKPKPKKGGKAKRDGAN
ncbi:hypothetical protein GGI01_000236 [Coemansia sp. RSA 376]|nr:hypothetical protein H4S03_005237 [Coemansia sp. S3946]KAJ2045122.1 hypothetical protein H4S04_005827 [Coemansia sp. S16]KAJ2111195.1 hypothetical protein IW146_005529 [Coemansia sp. RSA 922]KAJ2264011.1 hypothetical protein GGI01_000236 [Coemansia sp. RSA 376]